MAAPLSDADLVLPIGDADLPTVAPAGDVDGDGYADLLIRTAECNTQQEGNGAYLVYGGPERLQGSSVLRDVAARFIPAQRPAPETGEGLSCAAVSPRGRAGDPADLFTVSNVYTVAGETAFSGSAKQLHVHYGVLAAGRQAPLR